MEWVSRRRYPKPTCSAPCTMGYSSEIPIFHDTNTSRFLGLFSAFHGGRDEYSTYPSHTTISRGNYRTTRRSHRMFLLYFSLGQATSNMKVRVSS